MKVEILHLYCYRLCGFFQNKQRILLDRKRDQHVVHWHVHTVFLFLFYLLVTSLLFKKSGYHNKREIHFTVLIA